MAAQEKANTNNEVAVVAGSPVQRMLQDGAGQQSEFGLEVGLQGINGAPATGQDDSSGGGGSAIGVAVIVLILMAGGCGFGFWFCTKRRSRKEEEIVVNKNHQHGSTGSVGTYPSQRTVYSTSSDQYANHRGSAREDVQID
jgi:hypothetical protein